MTHKSDSGWSRCVSTVYSWVRPTGFPIPFQHNGSNQFGAEKFLGYQQARQVNGMRHMKLKREGSVARNKLLRLENFTFSKTQVRFVSQNAPIGFSTITISILGFKQQSRSLVVATYLLLYSMCLNLPNRLLIQTVISSISHNAFWKPPKSTFHCPSEIVQI